MNVSLIINSETKKLRNKPDFGIYDYIYREGDDIPDGHELVEGDTKDFSGMWLPKWTGDGWVESASHAEIEIIEMGLRTEDDDTPLQMGKGSYDDQLRHLRAAVMGLYELVMGGNDND